MNADRRPRRLNPRHFQNEMPGNQTLTRKRRFLIPRLRRGLKLKVMTQASVQTWCDRLQAKLMAALDATWETIAASDDPALIRQARDKAKACGEIAAMARKVAAMTPTARPSRPDGRLSEAFPPVGGGLEPRPARAIDRLKGGSRGRL